MRTVSENTTSKNAKTSFFYGNEHALASPKATGSWKYLSVDLQYLMFNAILKHNIKPTSCFQDTSSYRITGHARRFWVYWKKMSEYLYIYLIAWSHQTNYHSKQSSGQRNTKLWKLD